MSESDAESRVFTDSQAEQIVGSLRQIASSLGYSLLRESGLLENTKKEQILFLNGLGFDEDQIAILADTTVRTVRTRISEDKNK